MKIDFIYLFFTAYPLYPLRIKTLYERKEKHEINSINVTIYFPIYFIVFYKCKKVRINELLEASLIECHILIEFTLLIIFQLKITKLSDGEIEPNRVY